MLKPYTDIAAIPLSGGAITRFHKSLLPFGSFSDCKNLRGEHPSFRKRPGQIELHTTADGSNEVFSLYQFRKQRIDEKHFFAQMSDGDVLDATNAPPAVTTGAFGSEVFSGTGTGEVPAAYSMIDDIMLYSNGVDQHQTFTGTANYVNAVIVSTGNIDANVPEKGTDYTIQATDGLTSTVVVLDSFGQTALANAVTAVTKATPGVASSTAHALTLDDMVYFTSMDEMTELNGTYQTVTVIDSANTFSINDTIGYGSAESTGGLGFKSHAMFMCCPVKATSLTFTVSLPNGTVSTATLHYRKNDNTWADTSMTDGTITSSKTLAKTGSMTWTATTDEIPTYMYGQSGFWYQLRVSVALDSEVELTKITFGSGFQDLSNVWDGILPFGIEAMHYDDSASLYKTYGTGAVSIRLMEAAGSAGADDDKDRLYFNSFDNIMGIYIDVGSTPNTATTAVVYGVKAWTGSGFTTVGSITDGTNGLTNSGWITWPRLSTAEPSQFKTTQYYAYWFYFWIGTADLSSSVSISIFTMPFFDIERLGKGLCNAAWKDLAAYSFTNYSNYVYIAASGVPTALNGDQFGILKAGDGRTNKVVAMRKFYNELLVFQEETGIEGGTVTLFQGYSPTTFGKLSINSNIGTFSNKTVAVVDGIMTSTETTEEIKTLCFFLSRYGVCATDGLTISIISDDIQNYFDPTKTENIRRGYESKMWLNYDSAFNVIRIGLVTSTPRSTGTTTSTTSNKLVDTEGAFTTDGTAIGDTVKNTTDSTSASVTAIDSASTLSIDSDIMISGEAYSIVPGKPNVFPVFDLTDKTWSFDTPAQELSCMAEIEAGSGDIIVLQVAGGIDDGFVYLLNNGTNDVSTAIDSFFIMELNARGEYLNLVEMLLRAEAIAASAGDITVTFTRNTISAGSKTLSMSPEITNQTIRRHRFDLNIEDQNISIKVQNDDASKEMRLLDMGVKTDIYKAR